MTIKRSYARPRWPASPRGIDNSWRISGIRALRSPFPLTRSPMPILMLEIAGIIFTTSAAIARAITR